MNCLEILIKSAQKTRKRQKIPELVPNLIRSFHFFNHILKRQVFGVTQLQKLARVGMDLSDCDLNDEGFGAVAEFLGFHYLNVHQFPGLSEV